MQVNLDLLESEHLIGRLKLIELLERQCPYRNLPDRVERRFSQSLRIIPEDFREPALAIFGSVLYITDQILLDAWRYLWSALDERNRSLPALEDMLILELDRDLLRDEFYRANSLVGRLQDNVPWRSTQDIIDTLMHLGGGSVAPELLQTFKELGRKRLWVLLVDLSVSGTSVGSELARLNRIRSLFFQESEITVVALIQLATDCALQLLEERAHKYHCAIRLPMSNALNHSEYNLVGDKQLQQRMRGMCEWFAAKYVLPTDYRLSKISKETNDPQVAAFGFGGYGWNIVTHRNTPNNSLPILWFRPPDDSYRPPFERIDSRIGNTWSGRREWLNRVEENPELRMKIVRALS